MAYINTIKSLVLIFQNGDMYILSLILLHSDYFDYQWKALLTSKPGGRPYYQYTLSSFPINIKDKIGSCNINNYNSNMSSSLIKNSFNLTSFLGCIKPSFSNEKLNNEIFNKIIYYNLFSFKKVKDYYSNTNNKNLLEDIFIDSWCIINKDNFLNTTYTSQNITDLYKEDNIYLSDKEEFNNKLNNKLNNDLHNLSEVILIISSKKILIFIDFLNFEVKFLLNLEYNIVNFIIINFNNSYLEYILVKTEKHYYQLILNDEESNYHILNDFTNIRLNIIESFNFFSNVSLQNYNKEGIISCFNKDSNEINLYFLFDLKKYFKKINLKQIINNDYCYITNTFFYEKLLFIITNKNNECKINIIQTIFIDLHNNSINNINMHDNTNINNFCNFNLIDKNNILNEINNNNNNEKYCLLKDYYFYFKVKGNIIYNIKLNNLIRNKNKDNLIQNYSYYDSNSNNIFTFNTGYNISTIVFNDINTDYIIKELFTRIDYNYYNLRKFEVLNDSLNNVIIERLLVSFGKEKGKKYNEIDNFKYIIFNLLYSDKLFESNAIIDYLSQVIKSANSSNFNYIKKSYNICYYYLIYNLSKLLSNNNDKNINQIKKYICLIVSINAVLSNKKYYKSNILGLNDYIFSNISININYNTKNNIDTKEYIDKSNDVITKEDIYNKETNETRSFISNSLSVFSVDDLDYSFSASKDNDYLIYKPNLDKNSINKKQIDNLDGFGCVNEVFNSNLCLESKVTKYNSVLLNFDFVNYTERFTTIIYFNRFIQNLIGQYFNNNILLDNIINLKFNFYNSNSDVLNLLCKYTNSLDISIVYNVYQSIETDINCNDKNLISSIKENNILLLLNNYFNDCYISNMKKRIENIIVFILDKVFIHNIDINKKDKYINNYDIMNKSDNNLFIFNVDLITDVSYFNNENSNTSIDECSNIEKLKIIYKKIEKIKAFFDENFNNFKMKESLFYFIINIFYIKLGILYSEISVKEKEDNSKSNCFIEYLCYQIDSDYINLVKNKFKYINYLKNIKKIICFIDNKINLDKLNTNTIYTKTINNLLVNLKKDFINDIEFNTYIDNIIN